MSDSIDKSNNLKPGANAKFSKPSAKELKVDSPVDQAASSRAGEVSKENKSQYKEFSPSQRAVTNQGQQRSQESTNSISKETIIKATNPVVAAKLESGNLHRVKSKKYKKTPPMPSPKIINKVGAKAINPKKVKPNIPGRLKGFFDDRLRNIDKLSNAMIIDESPNLDKYSDLSKSIFEKSTDFVAQGSFAELFDLDYEFFVDDKQTISLNLCDKTELIEDKELIELFLKLINQFQTVPENQIYIPMIQLFLPIPYAYIFADLDDEFEKDKEELLEEDGQGFIDADEEDENKEDDKSEPKDNPSVTMSIKTINYGKMFFIIKYLRKTNNLKIAIKGSPIATELAIPIESNLEDDMQGYVNNIDYLLRLWRDNVMKITETRILKVESTGSLEPLLLRACNSILQTIHQSDIDLDGDFPLEADYNLV